MSLAIVHSRASNGIAAPPVTVEVHISGGLPRLSIVGLPEAAVKESKDRVRSALLNSHFEYPARRITVNLAPADLPKEGGRFDLPIALGILAATGQIPKDCLNDYEFTGELALSGELRPIHGALSFALHSCKANRQLILPEANAQEASLVEGLSLLPAKHLLEVSAHLLGRQLLTHYQTEVYPLEMKNDMPDLADVKGQSQPKRALEIAAAGQHSLLMSGPPGTGKSMLAARLSSILPEMSEEEALESAAIHSLSGHPLDHRRWRQRPFRAPHHTASSVALVGGGSPPKPGEISLAHGGVLFLDELPEYSRSVLEALREPLESGHVTISRASYQALFPAKFQFIAAMNPCPCGFLGDVNGRCQCTSEQVQRYQARISGPLLDRIDIHLLVLPLPLELLTAKSDHTTETSAQVRERVIRSRAIQLERSGKSNALLTAKELEKICPLEESDRQLLHQALEKFCLSPRGLHRILKVARTIADLDACPNINRAHLSEALSYRQLRQG